MKTYVCRLFFLKKLKKSQFLFYRPNIFFLIFQKRGIDRRMFSYSSPFFKVAAKNIDFSGYKAGETDMAHL